MAIPRRAGILSRWEGGREGGEGGREGGREGREGGREGGEGREGREGRGGRVGGREGGREDIVMLQVLASMYMYTHRCLDKNSFQWYKMLPPNSSPSPPTPFIRAVNHTLLHSPQR